MAGTGLELTEGDACEDVCHVIKTASHCQGGRPGDVGFFWVHALLLRKLTLYHIALTQYDGRNFSTTQKSKLRKARI